MAELFQKVKTQLVTFFQSLDKRKRMWLALGGLFVVVVIGAILLLTQPTYVPLTSGAVDYNQMSKMTAVLDAKTIGYKEQNGILMVDMNDLTKAKMALATDPSVASEGYTFLDFINNQSLTSTKDMREQEMNQYQATQLAESLKTLNGIRDARVQLHINPKSTVVLGNSEPSNASVFLSVSESVTLSQQQVSGIVNVISTAVPNLPKEMITILDQHGNQLNRFSDTSEAFIASSQMEQQLKVENHISDKIKQLLGAVYGRNNVRIETSVTLDFDAQTTNSVVFAPPIEGETTGLVRSMTELSEKVTSGDTAEGAPGTDSNPDTTDYPTGNNSGSDIEKTTRTVNNELNEVRTVLEKAKGTIKDINVSIIINSKLFENQLLPEEDKQIISDLVSTAAGIETRKVVVAGLQFTDNETGATIFDSESELTAPNIPLWLVGVIIGLIGLVVIVFFIISKAKAAKERADEIAKIQAEEEAKRQEELEEISMNREDKSSPKYQIEKFIDAKPEAVAMLLRSWMSEM